MSIIDSGREMAQLIMEMDGDRSPASRSLMTAEQAVQAAGMLRLLANAVYLARHQRDQGMHPLPVAPRSCHPYETEPGLRLFFYKQKQATDFTTWLLTLPVPQPEATSSGEPPPTEGSLPAGESDPWVTLGSGGGSPDVR